MNREILDLFYEKGNWILPKEGTLGNKATNLIKNEECIHEAGMNISRSLVMPFEILDKYNIYDILDVMEKYFLADKLIVVRSNAPDEDAVKRIPGLYVSKEIDISNRHGCYDPVIKVMSSYGNPIPESIRKKYNLEEKGMSLLVQKKIKLGWAGCFSDIGEFASLTFAYPGYGVEAMIKPSSKSHMIDLEGKIRTADFTTDEEGIARRLRKLTDHLPKLDDKGWEIEFGIKSNGEFYVFQTTPIEKKPRFQVRKSYKNIFDAREILGIGRFESNGIIYAPILYYQNRKGLVEFDAENPGLCLATVHNNLATIPEREHILKFTPNASVILDIGGYFETADPLSIHVRSFMREGRAALSGKFTDEILSSILLSGMDKRRLDPKINFKGLLYSPTKLIVESDEINKKAIVEVDGKIEPFREL